MSDTVGTDYGFVICRVRSRSDVHVIENALRGTTNVYSGGVTLPFDEPTIGQLTKVLKARWPGVEVKHTDVSREAQERGMSEADVLQQLSLVVLYIPDDGTGASFEVFADNIQVYLPFSHKPPAHHAALHRVWEYLDLFERELSCVTFDVPQRRVLDLARDLDSVKNKYELLHRSNGGDGDGPPKWWKLW